MRTLALSLSVLLTCSVTRAADMYIVTDLGTLGGEFSAAWSLNAHGVAAGQATLPPLEDLRAVTWNGTTNDLGTAGQRQSVAFAINDTGTVAGVSFELGEIGGTAVRWDAGVATVLGAFTPRDLNNAGVIAGVQTTTVNGISVRTAVRHDGTLTGLGTLGGDYSAAHAINDAGWIVGTSNDAGGWSRAFLWSGTMLDLGTLGGNWSQALALNDNGWIVGVSETTGGSPHACVFEVSSEGIVRNRIDLGELGTTGSHAFGVNNNDQVVGTSEWRAFIWEAGQMHDLNTRSRDATWELTHAMAINDAGQIVGRGRHGGLWRAFLLTPDDCPGDTNGDGRADLQDLAVVLANFGLAPATRPDGDLDGDGDVDLSDLGIVLANFGGTCD